MDVVMAAGVALPVAWAVTVPLRRHASAFGLLDRPNERSSHRVAMPRGGGIAIVLGVGAALLTLESVVDAGSSAWLVFVAAAAIGGVGLVDDCRGLSPIVRLIAQVVTAAGFISVAGPIQALPLPAPLDVPLAEPAAWTLSILWLVGVTNFFNFMDGIDGLAAGQAAATCAGVLVAGWSIDAGVLAAATGAACLGFLCHNWPPARIFMGDVGSGFLGFSLAALPFLAPGLRVHDAVLAVAIGMALFLLDPALTLVRRAVEGKNPMQAHREHLYQRLARPNQPVAPVTTAYVATAVLLAFGGAAAYRDPDLAWWGCGAALLAFAGVWWRARVT